MKLLASEHFRKKLEKWKILRITVLFFEEKKSRNPVYEMMKNEKQKFFENSNWNYKKCY